MKLMSVLLFAACLQVSAKGYTQHVTIHMENAPLESVLKEIKKQTGYSFFYESGLLQPAKPVTLTVDKYSVEQTLAICFRDQPFEYKVVENTVFIKRKQEVNIEPISGSDIKNDDLKGRVLTREGEPLISANVVNKRTGKGTTTDANGNFLLHDVRLDDILLITYTGYTPQSIKVNKFLAVTLVMEPAINQLDQVVMQAYGTTTKRLATGNISRISSEDISKQPVINVLNVLQGQAPGVVVTNTSGYASGAVKVEIRGRNSINPNFPSDPLYIIDGVPLTIMDLVGKDSYDNGSQGAIQSGLRSPANGQSPLFSLNPNDVESIEILKDAEATAIYGSRAANGAILITTKKGKAGKVHFDLSFYSGITQVNKRYQLLNTEQYIAMRREALKNDGISITVNSAPDLVLWDSTRYTDWQNYLWGNLGKSTSAQGSISGGDIRTNFRISGGFDYAKDYFIASGSNKRGSLSYNINTKSLNQRFSLGLTGLNSIATTNTIYIPGQITLYPNAPAIYDNNGKLNYPAWVPNDGAFPFGPLLQPYNTKTIFSNENLNLGYEIVKGLAIKSSFGYNNIQTTQTYLSPIASQNPRFNPKGSSSLGHTFVQNLIIEPQIEYKRFVGKGKLDVLVGGSSQQNRTSSDLLIGSGYNTDAFLLAISSAPTKTVSNATTDFKYVAGFGRLNYNLLNKYIISINGRRDGSTKFGPGRQFGNFGSIGAAWIFSEENWMKKNLPFLSFGKIRASIGTTGADPIPNYQYLSLWTFSNNTYNGNLPLNPIKHTDSLLHWEVNKKFEASISLGFLKDRITLDASFYRNTCNNQLVSFPTPAFSGFTFVTTNSPANVENIGGEFIVNAKIIERQRFVWSSRLNISINRNKLLNYPNLSESPYAGAYIVGKSLYIKKVLHNTGVDPQTGFYSFEDRDQDGKITIDQTGKTISDIYPLDLAPRFDGGFQNNIKYKNFELSFLFYFKKQIGINALSTLRPAGTDMNQPQNVLGRWQKIGDVTNIPKFTTRNDITFTRFTSYSDGIYGDASFIRLQNVSLSYSLPNKILAKAKIINCKIFLQGNNLFVISNYNGLDPEVQNFNSPPRPRIITSGITCNF